MAQRASRSYGRLMSSTSAKSDQSDTSDTVSFGFKAVPEDARQGLVNDVFSAVAGRYDLMNDLMSGGLHRLWKDDLIAWLAPPKGAQPFQLIDVAGGTGDITVRVLRAGGAGCTRACCSTSTPRWSPSAASAWPAAAIASPSPSATPRRCRFPTSRFDAYTIAFGIRNVTHIDKALAEACRVLKTGGRFLCLEFSDCEVPLLDRVYDFHSFEVIPRLGALAAGAAEPYRYLVESIRKFPKQETFAGDDPRRRLRARQLPQPHRRHRRHPFGLADLRGWLPVTQMSYSRSRAPPLLLPQPRLQIGLDILAWTNDMAEWEDAVRNARCEQCTPGFDRCAGSSSGRGRHTATGSRSSFARSGTIEERHASGAKQVGRDIGPTCVRLHGRPSRQRFQRHPCPHLGCRGGG